MQPRGSSGWKVQVVDNDLVLWLPSINAIVTGDSLSDFGDGSVEMTVA